MKLLVNADLGSACFDTGISCCLVSIKLTVNRATHFYVIPAVLLQDVPPPSNIADQRGWATFECLQTYCLKFEYYTVRAQHLQCLDSDVTLPYNFLSQMEYKQHSINTMSGSRKKPQDRTG